MFKRMRLALKLGLSFGLILLFLTAALLIARSELQTSRDALADIVDDNNLKIDLVHTMSQSVHVVSRVIRFMVLLDDLDEIKGEREKIQAVRQQYDQAWDALSKLGASERGLALREQIKPAADATRASVNRVMALALDNRDVEARQLILGEAGALAQQWQSALDAHVSYQRTINGEHLTAAQRAYDRLMALFLGIGIVTLLLVLVISIGISSSISAALGAEPVAVHDALHRLADGDLSVAITLRPGDQSSVMAATHRMANDLRSILQELGGLIDASNRGILDQRVDARRFTGEWRQISGGINQILDNVQRNSWELEQRNAALQAAQVELQERMQDKEARAALEQELAKQVIHAQLKSNFLANMSHEIRTPLHAIIGMAYLAQQVTSDPRQVNYLNKIDRASKQLLSIINDILDASKIEAGKLELETIELNLETVFEHLGNILTLKAEEKGLELLFDIDPSLPLVLLGDPLRLGQILLNLGSNAIKFTDSGQVTIGVVACRPAAQDGAAPPPPADQIELQFSVKDSGIGMTEAQCAGLFKSFAQADSSITRKFGGTGLGLSIAKSLVDLMGGTISAQSVLGVGSLFYFRVRLGKGMDSAGARAQRHALLSGKRILVVDDNREARQLLSALASSFGLQAQSVASGPQALQRLKQDQQHGHSPHFLLVDWKMPGMDGVELLAQIHQLQLSASPELLMVTAYRRDELLTELHQRRVHCAGVLDKPVSPSSLFNSLAAALRTGARAAATETTATETTATETTATETTATETTATETARFRQQLSGKRVLLVEDNELNQELAAELLRVVGLQVTVAGDGRQALQALAQDSDFAVVLMDCHMPVMDGYEASREIRRNPAWAELPIIALTADAMKGTKGKVLAAGMSDYLSKPLDVRLLYTVLLRWVGPPMVALDPAPAVGVPPSTVMVQPSPRLAASPELPGIDRVIALRVCSADHALLDKLLRMFYQRQANNFSARFASAQQDAQDPQAAHRCAHSLKGSARNIGAQALGGAAAALEQACTEAATPEQQALLCTAVQRELDIVLAGLAQQGYADPAPESPA